MKKKKIESLPALTLFDEANNLLLASEITVSYRHRIKPSQMPYYVREQEWRFNNRGNDLFALLVEIMCNFVPRD